MSPAKHSYASVTDGQTDGRTDRQTDERTDRQTTDKVIPTCRYASQATQKLTNDIECFSPFDKSTYTRWKQFIITKDLMHKAKFDNSLLFKSVHTLPSINNYTHTKFDIHFENPLNSN